MLSPGAKKAVENASPARLVSLIVLIHMDEALSQIGDTDDPRSRAQMIDRVYEKAKEPLLRDVRQYQSAGMKIVNSLEGTPQFILSGPARTWRKMIASGSKVVSDPNVELIANEPVWGIAPQDAIQGAA